MSKTLCYAILSLLLGLAANPIRAQHLDVLLQVVDGQVVTGEANYDTNTWLVGQKVYKRQFLSNFRTNDPGFTSLESGNPLLEPGVIGFEPEVDIFVDIVPSTIHGQRANFWYWDGLDFLSDGLSIEDVSFDLAPPGVRWHLYDYDFQQFTADGSDTVVPDALVQTTFRSDGALHNHLLFQLTGPTSRPPEGIYLVSLVARGEGYESSDPFFFIHRTAGLSQEPRDIATTWVRENYVPLTEESLLGDYNGNGTVDAADYTMWHDGNRPNSSTAGYILWADNFGQSSASSSGANPVPESTTLLLALLAFVAAPLRVRCG